MARRKGRYKEVIKEKVVSIRLNEEEFLRLRVDALRGRSSVSQIIRARIADLIGGSLPAGTAIVRGDTVAPGGNNTVINSGAVVRCPATADIRGECAG